MRMWRNWQTRRFQVPVGDHMGSSPFIRTRSGWKQAKSLFSVFFCAFFRNGVDSGAGKIGKGNERISQE